MRGKGINNNNHDYVDLNLPSGTLWSTMNVGAHKPTDTGLYFQWGDIIGYSPDQISRSKEKKTFDWPDYKFSIDGSYSNLSKYTTLGETLYLEDDAAHIFMHGDWHMPTPTQFKELIDETISNWVTLNGTNGMKFSSKKDPTKYIFIPAAGDAYRGSIHNSGIEAYIWSSMLDDTWGAYNAQGLEFYCYSKNSGHVFCHGGDRCYGFSIRGVIG